jgi:hypothetical protein
VGHSLALLQVGGDQCSLKRFARDSLLEEAVQSELVSEMGFLAPGNYGAIPKRLWMITEAEEGYFGL